MRKLMLILLAISTAAFGEEYILQVRDITRGPLTGSGTVTMYETANSDQRQLAYSDRTSTTNVSSRNIVMFVQRLRVRFSDGTVREDVRHYDGFFSSNSLKPGQTLEFPPHEPSPETVPEQGGEAKPDCTSETLYIQFEDGTVWGTEAYATETLETRAQIWSALGSLSTAYEKGGESAFEKLLADKSQFSDSANAFLEMVRVAYASKGDDGAITQVHEELRVASERQTRLNEQKAR